MHRTQHRLLLTMTAGVAALAFGAAPALAGSDGCSGDDCAAANAPAPLVRLAPVPVAPRPLDDIGSAPERVAVPRARRAHHVHAVTVADLTVVPRGAVAAGAGGTAASGPDSSLGLLAAGALWLLAAGGGLVAVNRRGAS